jgi:hypothetical protein
MPRKPSATVHALWASLWATPQAVAWEELGWIRTVARYATLLIAAERKNAPVKLLAEVRQLEDRLGLSPWAMKRLQWEITDASMEESAPADVAKLDDYRELYGG